MRVYDSTEQYLVLPVSGMRSFASFVLPPSRLVERLEDTFPCGDDGEPGQSLADWVSSASINDQIFSPMGDIRIVRIR